MGEAKPLALLDSSVVVFSMVADFPTREDHQKCLRLIEKGLKGELGHILCLNPIVVVETYSTLGRLLNWREAELRVGALLRSRRMAFLLISRDAAQSSVRWAKEKQIPVNDAMMGANTVELADLIYTTDEDHFMRLQEYGVKLVNPLKLSN